MESKHSLRKSKLFRALLILLLIAVPVQWAAAQLTLSTPRTTLGTVIKQIQSQSKYQFFYNDKLSTVTVEPLKVKDASLDGLLSRQSFQSLNALGGSHCPISYLTDRCSLTERLAKVWQGTPAFLQIARKIAADTASVVYFWLALYLITIPSFMAGRLVGSANSP